MTWLGRLLRRPRLERELDAELEFHIDRLAADYAAEGLTERDARRRALEEFGVVDLVKQDCRRARGTEWLRDLAIDTRIGVRLLRKEPMFSAIAIGALALGLGVNTVFFSMVRTYCLTGLPYPAANRLVAISIRGQSGHAQPMSLRLARALDASALFQRVGWYATRHLAVRVRESPPVRRTVAYVSADVVPLIDESLAAGRSFRPEEHAAPADVVLLSKALADELFGAGVAAIDRTVFVDGAEKTIIGVMGAGSKFPADASVWEPLADLRLPDAEPALTVFADPLAATGSGESVQGRLDGTLKHLGLLPDDRERVAMTPLNDDYRGRVSDPAWIAFIVAGGLVVLIACSNVGNLLLSRGVRRTAEIATRVSLGASRVRILRQLLTETLVLAAVACVVAASVAALALEGLRALIPPQAIPYWTALDLDWRSAGVLAIVGLSTALLSGLAPALQLARVDRTPINTRSATESRSVNRWATLFLTVQLALSVVLLSAVGMTVQAYRALSKAATVGKVADVLSAELSLSTTRYPTPDARERLLNDLRRHLKASGLVNDVSIAPTLPGDRGTPRGLVAGALSAPAMVAAVEIGPDYFQTLGVPLLSGHELSEDDRDISGSSVVINERLARLCFGDVPAVGRVLRFVGRDNGASSSDSRTIAGVVPSFGGQTGLTAPPVVFVPRAIGSPTATLLLRGPAAPAAIAPVLRDSVARLDPNLPLSDVLPLLEASWQARWNGRVSQLLITAIATIGLSLAMVGVGALTAHRIAARRRELSIRVALGARPSQLFRAALTPLMVQLACALLIGGLLAAAWQRVFASPDASIANLMLVWALVSVATIAFGLWPASRAARVDPIDALRADV